MTTPALQPPTGSSHRPIRYTAAHMDALIRQSMEVRKQLRAAGHIDVFGNPVMPQPKQEEPQPVTHKGYCMKCQASKEVPTAGVVDHNNGTKRAHGKCPDCGTPVHRIMSAADGAALAQQLDAR